MRVFAPAKINLALHVTRRRSDGYHLLDSLVVFADVGDWVTLEPANKLSLEVTGPRAAGVPADRHNLVWQAAEVMGATAAIRLEKHLPHAGGIGGGSADAAATLRGLSALHGLDLPDPEQILSLGADLPVCLASTPAHMRGIGERVDPVRPLPALWCVLVNAGIEVPTGAVFRALSNVENPTLPAFDWHDTESLISWLALSRNDLQRPAIALVPEIATVIAGIAATDGCRFARMSGSGGTCFGLFTSLGAMRSAEARLRLEHPEWWVSGGSLLDDRRSHDPI